jgi:hypothetical protein
MNPPNEIQAWIIRLRLRQPSWKRNFAGGMRADRYPIALAKWLWWGWKFRHSTPKVTQETINHNPFGWFYAGDDAIEKIGKVENETTRALDLIAKAGTA